MTTIRTLYNEFLDDAARSTGSFRPIRFASVANIGYIPFDAMKRAEDNLPPSKLVLPVQGSSFDGRYLRVFEGTTNAQLYGMLAGTATGDPRIAQGGIDGFVRALGAFRSENEWDAGPEGDPYSRYMRSMFRMMFSLGEPSLHVSTPMSLAPLSDSFGTIPLPDLEQKTGFTVVDPRSLTGGHVIDFHQGTSPLFDIRLIKVRDVRATYLGISPSIGWNKGPVMIYDLTTTNHNERTSNEPSPSSNDGQPRATRINYDVPRCSLGFLQPHIAAMQKIAMDNNPRTIHLKKAGDGTYARPAQASDRDPAQPSNERSEETGGSHPHFSFSLEDAINHRRILESIREPPFRSTRYVQPSPSPRASGLDDDTSDTGGTLAKAIDQLRKLGLPEDT